jgi:hypothetical protein
MVLTQVQRVTNQRQKVKGAGIQQKDRSHGDGNLSFRDGKNRS